MSIDDKHSDQELKAYLDGRDGVSAAYRKTAQEEPPRALDAAILAAARKHAQPSAETWYVSRRPYAMAASFMIAVVVVSLYFTSLDEIVVPAATEEATVRVVEVRRAEAENDEGVTEAATGGETPQADLAAPPAFETRQLAPAVPTIGAANPIAAPAAPAVEITNDAFARAADSPPVVIDGPLLEEIEAEAANAQAAQQGIAEESEDDGLEEIVVTGSRITRREDDVPYRQSQEAWLAEIRARVEALGGVEFLDANPDEVDAELQEEVDLFLEAYPEVDLEAELAEEE